ncbi:UNVERIFIED_CONTAM: hypothetical protein K2H54_069116 [Gekko kuhli]
MVANAGDPDPDDMPASRRELRESLQALERNMSTMITELLKPINSQLKDINQTLSQKISVLQDLSPETLQRWKALKPITSLLTKEGIRYKWVSYCKLQVNFQGTLLHATDLDSGLKLLQELQLQPPQNLPVEELPRHRDPVDVRWRTIQERRNPGGKRD